MMYNELLWVFLMLSSFLIIILAYKFFGKIGLFVWTAVAIVIANIQVMKTIQLVGAVVALGNVVYGSTFLVTDILEENYGKKDANKAVWIGFFTMVAFTLMMQICLFFIADASDMMGPHLNAIFGLLPRITIASLTAYLVSQLYDVWVYGKIKKATKGKMLWLRNIGSTIGSQLLDNVVFTWIAFVGFFGLFGWKQVFDWPIVISIFVTSYIMKFVVLLLDTPFIYIAKKMKNKVPK